MSSPPAADNLARQRTLLFLAHPELWQHWPFLPMVRRKPDGEQELGLVYDAREAIDRTGFSSTVWLCNLFLMPPTLEQFLQLPREVFDTFEEVSDAGWSVD